MNRWLFFWRKMRRQLWVRATAYAAAGVAAALLAAALAPWVPQEVAARLGGQSVESILTILASSLLGVATFRSAPWSRPIRRYPRRPVRASRPW